MECLGAAVKLYSTSAHISRFVADDLPLKQVSGQCARRRALLTFSLALQKHLSEDLSAALCRLVWVEDRETVFGAGEGLSAGTWVRCAPPSCAASTLRWSPRGLCRNVSSHKC